MHAEHNVVWGRIVAMGARKWWKSLLKIIIPVPHSSLTDFEGGGISPVVSLMWMLLQS